MGNELKKQAKAVNKQGDKLFKEGLYSDAIKMYVESVKMMKEVGDLKAAQNYQAELEKAIMKRSEQINTEGDKLLKEKQFQKAMDIYQKACDLLVKAGEKWVKKKGKEFEKELLRAKDLYADELMGQSENLVKAKDWDGAVDIYKTIKQIIDKKIDKKLYERTTKKMESVYERWADEINKEGDILYKAQKFEEAIPKYSKSVSLINRSGSEKKQKAYLKELSATFAKHAQIINSHGDKLMKQKKFMEASEFYAESVQIAEESGNEKLIKNFTKEMMTAYESYAKEINVQGDKLYKEKKFTEAAKIYERSVEAANNSKNQKLIKNFTNEYQKAMGKWADGVNAQGDAAMKKKEFDQAFKFYKESVEVIKKTADGKKVKQYTAEFKSACEKLAKELNSVGDADYKNGEYEKAYNNYSKSVNLIEASGNSKLMNKFTKERNKALEKMNE